MVYALRMRALGIDYGRRRIGLAVSDATGLLARPWKTITVSDEPESVASVLAGEASALAAEDDGLSAIALGYPRRLNGEPSEQTAIVEAIAAALRLLVDSQRDFSDDALALLLDASYGALDSLDVTTPGEPGRISLCEAAGGNGNE